MIASLNTEFAFTAARQAFEKLMVQKIISLKISEKETLADLLKRKDMESRYELALYLCRVAGGVESMPKIKCKFPSLGGGYLELNKMANYSGRITYQLLFQDLADLFAQEDRSRGKRKRDRPDGQRTQPYRKGKSRRRRGRREEGYPHRERVDARRERLHEQFFYADGLRARLFLFETVEDHLPADEGEQSERQPRRDLLHRRGERRAAVIPQNGHQKLKKSVEQGDQERLSHPHLRLDHSVGHTHGDRVHRKRDPEQNDFPYRHSNSPKGALPFAARSENKKKTYVRKKDRT